MALSFFFVILIFLVVWLLVAMHASDEAPLKPHGKYFVHDLLNAWKEFIEYVELPELKLPYHANFPG